MNSRIIQFIKFGAYSDLLMSTAVLKPLKKEGWFIRYICHSDYANVLIHNPYIDELIPIQTTISEEFDNVVVAWQNGVLNALSERSEADKTISFQWPVEPYTIIHPLGFSSKIQLPVAHHYCYLAETPPNDELYLGIPDEIQTWGKQFENTLLIHTFSGSSPYKDWSSFRWENLAYELTKITGMDIYQLGKNQDPLLNEVDRIITPTILHAASAIKSCQALITVDSVFNHISRALKKSSVVLWGSSNPLAFGYHQNINIVNGVQWDYTSGNQGPLMSCQPCYREYRHLQFEPNNSVKPVCPYTVAVENRVLPTTFHPEKEMHACMASISEEIVIKAVLDVLNLQKR